MVAFVRTIGTEAKCRRALYRALARRVFSLSGLRRPWRSTFRAIGEDLPMPRHRQHQTTLIARSFL
jgi:hypothetical protein